MLPASRWRSFWMGLMVSGALGLSLLLLQYTLALPTGDLRARMVSLLANAPWSIGLPLFALLVVAGELGLLVSGWRTLGAAAGALVGAGLVYLVLRSGVFGYLVWRYPEQVTGVGQAGRVVAALALGALALGWAHRLHRVAREG
jgi:hypothetical protein